MVTRKGRARTRMPSLTQSVSVVHHKTLICRRRITEKKLARRPEPRERQPCRGYRNATVYRRRHLEDLHVQDLEAELI